MLFGFDLVALAILIPILYTSGLLEEDPLVLVFALGMIVVFFISPHLLLYIFQKQKWTEFDSDLRVVHLIENKRIIRTIPFDQIQYIYISEYTYTLKTKNGSRTITVFTVLGHLEGESVQLSESTNYPEIRQFSESIAKLLKTSIQTKTNELIPYTELDLPIHKRKRPKEILESEISFDPNSYISVQRTSTESLLKSNYRPKIFIFVGITVSFALILMIHFAIGSAFELSVEFWQTFPPNKIQIGFLIISLLLGFMPILSVWWNYKKRKEIRITKDTIFWNEIAYPFQNWEEILFKENTLYIVNDRETKTHSLFFFCQPSDCLSVYNWILKEIVFRSGESVDFSRF
ncbi:hypothetical protein EHQ47_15255 [Leptospira bourretii]|nr:hypothetical protein EHQ47_15255 [Leptospira bourretii]